MSGSVHLHSSGLLTCLVCCPVWIIIPYKEVFHILWYQTVQKVHCLMCQVQLTVPVGLHHQRNICCKTWHKISGTEVCIGCHTLYWQFYQQWTDGSWCVAPTCCLHTVVVGIVCDIGTLLWSYVSVVIVVAPVHIFCPSTSFVHRFTDISYRSASSHKAVWYMSLQGSSQICHVSIWVSICWTVTSVCVCARARACVRICGRVRFLKMYLCHSITEICNMTNSNLATLKPNGKQFISKLLHFGNLNIKHKGKKLAFWVHRLRVNLM